MVRIGVMGDICMLRSVSIAALFLFCGGQAVAQSTDQRALQDDPDIIVTATRAPVARAEVGSSVTVITAEDLQRRQAVSVVDVLRDVAGVTFNRNGGIGTVSSVRLRGAESDQTVVLIDGVKLNDPSSPGGGFNFANLLVGNLERIEVLRGPQSTLYGSQAIGGVVNLITRSGAGPLQFALDAEIGELETRRVRGDLSGGTERYSYALAAGRFESDSISAFDERLGGRERDGYENSAVNGRFTFAITPSLEADVRGWWSSSEVGVDGFAPPTFALTDVAEFSETEEQIGYLGLNWRLLNGRLSNRIAVTRSQIERSSLNPQLAVAATFEAEGTNERVELQSTFDVTQRLQLIGGFEREDAQLRTRSPSVAVPNPTPVSSSAVLEAVYLQVQARPTDGLTATLGMRRTDDDRFGEAISLRATVAYTPNDGAIVLRASVGDGFKAPTPFQLFSDFGNTRLAPEESFAWDVGVEQNWLNGRVRTGLTYFRRDTKNQIDFVSCFASSNPICVGRPFGTYDNVAKTFADGVEASLAWQPTDNWQIDATYTTLDARNRVAGSANFGRVLARRADQTATLSVRHAFDGGHDLGASVTQVGDSFDNASNSVRLEGYTLVSLRGSVQLREGLSLYGRVENATDEAYQTTFRYGSPPRQAFFGVRASF
jgi:vitamin B12 transporter